MVTNFEGMSVFVLVSLVSRIFLLVWVILLLPMLLLYNTYSIKQPSTAETLKKKR